MVEPVVARKALPRVVPQHDPLDGGVVLLLTYLIERLLELRAPRLRQLQHGLLASAGIGVARLPRREALPALLLDALQRFEEVGGFVHGVAVHRGVLDAEPIGLPLVVAAVLEKQQL
jgi:hypothetical protein